MSKGYKAWKDEPFDWAPQRKLGTKGWIAYSDGPAAPPPTDYKGAAQETAAGNLSAARSQTAANRVNQTTPWGTQTYTQGDGFDQAGYDEAMARYQGMEDALNANPDGSQMRQYMAAIGQTNERPDRNNYINNPDKWSSEVTLNPELQATLEAQNKVDRTKAELAQQGLGQLSSTMSKPFETKDLADYLKGVVPIDQSAQNVQDYVGQLQKLGVDAPTIQKYLAGVQQVNQNVDQYDPAQAAQFGKAAFDAQNTWLQPDQERDMDALRRKLALQGVTLGSEAEYGATKSLSDTQAQAKQSLASGAYVTGNQVAQGAYATKLSGVQAQLAAQQQAFAQGLAGQQADLTSYNSNNDAINKNRANALNEATTQQSINNQANVARNQFYQNALQEYQTNYAKDYANYMMPLNVTNALLSGTQVASPQFNSYNAQGQTMGADYSGAAAAQGAQNQSQFNAGAAAAAANNSAATSLVGAGIGAWGAAAGAGAVAFF